LFPFYLLGAVGFLIFGRSLLLDYLMVGALTFVVFMLASPWLPGRRGITKVLLLDLVLGGALVGTELLLEGGSPLRADLIIAMVMLLVYGSELGGLAPTAPSDLDPFLARIGIARRTPNHGRD